MTKPFTKEMQLSKNKKARRKRCKLESCNKLFIPKRDMQPCCSFDCEVEYATSSKNLKGLIEDGKKLRDKEANKRKKDARSKEKSRQLTLTERVVNEYIRLRDKRKPCCTCGGYDRIEFHAGHFESAGGNQQQRFYTLNIHKQCSQCNTHLHSNSKEYKKFMIKKYGIEKTEEIENNHDRGHYTVEYLHRLRKVFRKKIKLYERKFRG